MNMYYKTVIQDSSKWIILAILQTLTKDDPAIEACIQAYRDKGHKTFVNTYWIDETKFLPEVPGGYTSGT